MTILTNGVGAVTGDGLSVAAPVYLSGEVWYVYSVNGNDSNAGTSKLEPLATIAQAISNAASDDLILCLDGHAETLTSVQAVAKRLTIMGEGVSAGIPTVKFTNNQAAASLFDITATDVQFRNIRFPPETVANSAARITADVARTAFIGCYFEADGNQNAAVVEINTGAEGLVVENTTFISTETADDDAPDVGLEITAAMSNVTMKGAIFDGGTQGWKDFSLKASAAAVTNFRGEGLSFLRGADASLHASSTGYIQPSTTTGAVRIDGLG